MSRLARSAVAAAALATVGLSLGPSADARKPSLEGLPPMEIDERCFSAEATGAARSQAYGAGLGTVRGRGGAAVQRKTRATAQAPALDATAAAAPPPPAPVTAAAEPAEAEAEERPPARGDRFGADADDASVVAEIPDSRPQGAVIDWGGVVHLSNDDSMSLASAQRLLYALDRGVGFTTDQIRPHELLNYFTFDTERPDGPDTFAVSTSAFTDTDDELTLAVAIQGATPPRPPVDLTLLVDRSGSMRAEGRMSYTQRALKLAQQGLSDGDRVDLVVFDHDDCTPVKNFVVGRDDPAVLSGLIDRMQPRGSTDLDRGLKTAYALATEHARQPGRSGRVMVFTDALLNTGDVDPHTVTEVGRALDAHDIRLTGVGVGREFRDDVLDTLTEKGKGAYVFLGSERVVDRLFGAGFDALVHTLALDVRFALDLPESLGMKTFYGEESSTDPADVDPVNYQAGNSQVFLQDLAVRDGRLRRRDPITLTLSWEDPSTGTRQQQRHTFTVAEALGEDDHNARKGAALMAWTDILYAHALGGQACGEPLTAYRRHLGHLQGDAEIAYVSELIGAWCGEPAPLASWTGPARTRVKLDADQTITEVELVCDGRRQSRSLTGSDSVATFETQPGTCLLTLHGAVPMNTTVRIPETGTDLRCVVRGGRMSCS